MKRVEMKGLEDELEFITVRQSSIVLFKKAKLRNPRRELSIWGLSLQNPLKKGIWREAKGEAVTEATNIWKQQRRPGRRFNKGCP